MADEDYMDDNELSTSRLSDEALDDDSSLLEEDSNASNDTDDVFPERSVAHAANRKRDIEDYFDRRQLANLDDWYSNL